MLAKPPSWIAAVMLAALYLTKQLIIFLSISQVSKIDIILLRRFCDVCLSHIGKVSRTANLRLNLSSMKCAVMLRYESTAWDVQQSVVSTKNIHSKLYTSFYHLMDILIHFGNDSFRKVLVTRYLVSLVHGI